MPIAGPFPLASAELSDVASAAKAALSLGNVNNTSDANKPISTATQTALDGKSPVINVMAAPYSAVADGRRADAVSVVSGLTALTGGYAFVAGDVGKFLRVVGAGVAGAGLVTTIAA